MLSDSTIVSEREITPVETPQVEDIFLLGHTEPISSEEYLKMSRKDYAQLRVTHEIAYKQGEPLARFFGYHSGIALETVGAVHLPVRIYTE